MNTSQTFLINQGEKLNFTESNNGDQLDEEGLDSFLPSSQLSDKKNLIIFREAAMNAKEMTTPERKLQFHHVSASSYRQNRQLKQTTF